MYNRRKKNKKPKQLPHANYNDSRLEEKWAEVEGEREGNYVHSKRKKNSYNPNEQHKKKHYPYNRTKNKTNIPTVYYDGNLQEILSKSFENFPSYNQNVDNGKIGSKTYCQEDDEYECENEDEDEDSDSDSDSEECEVENAYDKKDSVALMMDSVEYGKNCHELETNNKISELFNYLKRKDLEMDKNKKFNILYVVIFILFFVTWNFLYPKYFIGHLK